MIRGENLYIFNKKRKSQVEIRISPRTRKGVIPMEEQKAKYEEIADWIKEKLDRGEIRAGDRIESEHQLCETFHVSRQTVRHAVQVLENEGIVERRRGSGTYIREAVKIQEKETKTMQVAVMTTYVQEYIFPTIIQKIENELSGSGYGMQLSFTNNTVEKERFILKSILEKNMVDGLIAEPTKSGLPNPNLDMYRKIMKKGIPVLFINSCYPELEAPHVGLNDFQAGKMATRYLLKCGHRRIAGIFKSDDRQGHIRYAGYMEALMEAEIPIRSRQVLWMDSEDVKDVKAEASRILKRIDGCTACVCYNDEVASGLVGVCLEQGIRVPEDISVIGIDDSDLARFCEVPLTTVKNPVDELGKTAALEMLEMMQGLPVPQSMELDSVIINRSSVRLEKGI